MISPISSINSSNKTFNQSKSNNNVSFSGITRIKVLSSELPYTSKGDIKSAAAKIRNILFNKKKTKSDEIKTIYENIKRNFHLLDKDYYIPEAKVDVTEPYFAVIRTGKNSYFLSGTEALAFKDVEKNIGYDSPEWVNMKEFYDRMFSRQQGKPTLTVVIDKKRNIKEVSMEKNGIQNFKVAFPESVKKLTIKEPKASTPKNSPLSTEIKPKEELPKYKQMTFDF